MILTADSKNNHGQILPRQFSPYANNCRICKNRNSWLIEVFDDGLVLDHPDQLKELRQTIYVRSERVDRNVDNHA